MPTDRTARRSPKQPHGRGWNVTLEASLLKLHDALAALATELQAHGAPFSSIVVPPPRMATARIAPEGEVARAIALVHEVFRVRGSHPGAISVAVKAVGNAARQVRHVARREAELRAIDAGTAA